MRGACVPVGALVALLFAAGADAQPRPRQRLPHPTPLWAAAQLVPSPEWVLRDGESHFGLRWNITPVLVSFALRPGLNPWRTLVAEPLVRFGGSFELVVSPELILLPGRFAQQWGLRTGLRAHLPLLDRGEYLSASLGVSHFYYREEHGFGVEAGATVLYGLLGVRLTFTPWLLGASAWIVTLELRYL